jgi:hypothetical protein
VSSWELRQHLGLQPWSRNSDGGYVGPIAKPDVNDVPVTEPSRRERKAAADAIKLDRGCQDPRCAGFPPVAFVLSFDHRDPKDFAISAAVINLNKQRVSNIRPRWTYPRLTWPEVLAEIAKCDVVCLNCHALRTEDRRHQKVIGQPEYGMPTELAHKLRWDRRSPIPEDVS